MIINRLIDKIQIEIPSISYGMHTIILHIANYPSVLNCLNFENVRTFVRYAISRIATSFVPIQFYTPKTIFAVRSRCCNIASEITYTVIIV